MPTTKQDQLWGNQPIPKDAKRCPKCGNVKPLDQFNARSDVKGGRQSWCRACNKGNLCNEYWDDPDHSRAEKRRYYRKNRRSPQPRSTARRPAHDAVAQAVSSGELIRATVCEQCKQPDVKTDAHHEDYMKPLDVIWLCRRCHIRLHHNITYPLVRACDVFSIEGVLNGQM